MCSEGSREGPHPRKLHLLAGWVDNRPSVLLAPRNPGSSPSCYALQSEFDRALHGVCKNGLSCSDTSRLMLVSPHVPPLPRLSSQQHTVALVLAQDVPRLIMSRLPSRHHRSHRQTSHTHHHLLSAMYPNVSYAVSDPATTELSTAARCRGPIFPDLRVLVAETVSPRHVRASTTDLRTGAVGSLLPLLA